MLWFIQNFLKTERAVIPSLHENKQKNTKAIFGQVIKQTSHSV